LHSTNTSSKNQSLRRERCLHPVCSYEDLQREKQLLCQLPRHERLLL